jgi:hypothetical protein
VSFQYTNPAVPEEYRCGTCGAHGCKLWRKYQTCLERQWLYCCACAGKDQNHDVTGIDDNGMSVSAAGADANGKIWPGRLHDSIGWLVPAVPTEDRATYWGYSSVPDTGVAWWHALPTRPA